MKTDSPQHQTICILLEQKAKAWREFLSATISLKERCSSQDAVTDDEEHIAARQKIIHVIDTIDCRINKILAGDPGYFASLSHDERKKEKSLIQMITDTAAQASRINEEAEALLRRSHDDLRSRILTLIHARKNHHGYSRKEPGSPQPRFLDVTS